MMEVLWVFRLAVVLVLCAGFSVALFLAWPKALKHYFLWKTTREEKHLATCFADGGIALFILVAIFAIALKKISIWWNTYGY